MLTQTLISSDLNVHVGAFDLTSAQAAPDCPHAWSVRMRRLHGGRQEGVDLIEIDSGAMTLRVVPTRGMNVLDVRCGDLRLGWNSPVREVVHPAFVDVHSRGAIGWLAGFNEFIARCGLEWFGAPCEDTHHLAAGEAPAGPLTLHGKVSNTPASIVELTVEQRPPFRLRLRGVVREAMLFGPKLELRSELVVTPGANTFAMEDAVTNRSAGAEEFGLLYHCNFGRPLLEDGATLIAPAKTVTPMTERACEGGVANYHNYGPPTPGYTEQNYMLELAADRTGRTEVMLQNQARDRGVSMAWALKQLPCFTLWKNTQPEADGYVTGLEPGTNHPFPRPYERKMKRIKRLRPGATHKAAIEFTVHGDKKSVAEATKYIDALLGGKKTTFVKSPPVVEW